MSTLRWLDFVVIALYMGAMAVIGLRFARRQTSTERYFVAQRSIPGWAMGVSIYATLITSITFTAYPGSAYAGNWSELVPGFMVIGTLVWAYYQLSGEVLPAHIDKADKIFPYFLATKIPAGLAGLFMASLFAAAMSMLSSDLNCLSVVGVEDYYRKLRPNSTDRQRLAVGKMIVAVCGTVSILIAIVIAWKSERVLSFYFTVSSIVAGGLAGLFLLAFLNPRANKQGVYIGIACCLLFTTWGTLTNGNERVLDLGRYNFNMPGVMIGVIAHIVLLVSGWLASFGFAAPDPGVQAMTLRGWLKQRKSARQPPATVPPIPEP
jgi:SSS family solute:Na+ symporter